MMLEMIDENYVPGRCLCCLRFRRFTVETHTMYKIGLVRLGIVQALLAAACLPEGGALMALNKNSSWSGVGIWVGVPILFSGLSCIVYSQRRPSQKLSVGTGLSISAVFASTFLIISSIINLAGCTTDVGHFYPLYDSENLTPLYVCNALLLMIGSLQLPCAILSLMHYLGVSCACCRVHMNGVFTIDNEENQDYSWDAFDTPAAPQQF